MATVKTSFSPPITAFPTATIFKFLASDPTAWDLGYLSWDFERGMRPDAQFSVNIHRTLQFVLATGAIDLANSQPAADKVRGLIKGPAPQVALAIASMARLKQTHMYLAYGDVWLETLRQRSHLYREPHNEVLDFAVTDCSKAMEFIRKLK